MGALSRLRVIELGQMVSAPYCAKLFSDLGAQVVKVEEPGVGDAARRCGPFPGDKPHPDRSGLFRYLNTNKLGVTLNLRTLTGRKIFIDLLNDAQVLIENTPPALSQELGINYEALQACNPGLIVTSIAPFGQTGPYRDYKAYAFNISAASGPTMQMGEPGREPIALPMSLIHFQSGVMAAAATMGALLGRRRTKKGLHIDVSEADVWATFHTGPAVNSFVYRNTKMMRTGYLTPQIFPAAVIPCRDGFISMVNLKGKQWKAFLELVGDGKVPDWYANDPRFKNTADVAYKYFGEVEAALTPWLMKHTREEIFRMCKEKDVPYGPVRKINDVVLDQHLNEREFFIRECNPDGTVVMPGAPYRLSETPWQHAASAPTLGQHNMDVLCGWLGYGREEVAQMAISGIV